MTAVLEYHQTTKHSFHRFARSLGYLDWAAQPDPFRRFDGAPRLPLPHAALRPDVPYPALFAGGVPPAPLDVAAVGEFLRCAMGLSAWKQYQANRWALRVNPSSGNLHPTECYVLWHDRVCHYAPREHELEVRAELVEGRAESAGYSADGFLVGLTSILWREAWKYGERAFRYCQHDVGHAIGALRFSAALLGWRLAMVTASDAQLGAVLGTDRDADFAGAEREEPECLLLVTATGRHRDVEIAPVVERARAATWTGQANALSRARVEWPVIDAVAAATRRGSAGAAASDARATSTPDAGAPLRASASALAPSSPSPQHPHSRPRPELRPRPHRRPDPHPRGRSSCNGAAPSASTPDRRCPPPGSWRCWTGRGPPVRPGTRSIGRRRCI